MRICLLALLSLSSCSMLQAHTSGEITYACGKPVNANDYCGNFKATEALRSDPDAQRVRVHCLNFFREAVRSTKFICSYLEEMDQLISSGDGQDSATIAAKGMQIRRNYTSRASLDFERLERVYSIAGGRGSQGAIEELDYDGRRNLEGELGCEDRSSHRAPGFELLGLAAQTRREQKAIFDRLESVFSLFSRADVLQNNWLYLSIRMAMGFTYDDKSYQGAIDRLISSRLDEPALIALGKAEVPPSPVVEKYYAYLMKQVTSPSDASHVLREESSGRSLASVRCYR